ncbi:hypothetical protein BIU90_08600 [Curtobacterium sp. MCBA15_001]|nr:hypothetical protein BIU90_08600 [Curtobacterium sp. MCBA15_001]
MTAMPLPERPPTFRTYRVVAVSEHRGPELEATYGLSEGVDGSLDQFQYSGAGDADLSMRGATVEGTRVGRMQQRPDHIVFWIGDGTATVTPDEAETLTATPGRPMLLSAGVVYDFTADTRKVTMLHLSEELLRRCLAARGVHLAGPLAFDEQPDGTDALRRLQGELRRSTPGLVDPTVTGAARAALNARVADAVVCAFPVRAVPVAASTAVSRVLDLMHHDARTALSLEDLAAASGLSVRGLQNAFARDLGTTPTRYLRDLRLDGAHREIEAGEAASVADVARDWQFHHLGRFASAYGERFGERPSETLRRQRG